MFLSIQCSRLSCLFSVSPKVIHKPQILSNDPSSSLQTLLSHVSFTLIFRLPKTFCESQFFLRLDTTVRSPKNEHVFVSSKGENKRFDAIWCRRSSPLSSPSVVRCLF
ncbi:hypothetical protein L596_008534 [Steinernema carpocapsae]|uniref:Uncharacterized protein n=1 Tax=Steinernema carpocapsae TaxID=34508 RepID=A0A4U5PCW2_STECR|nr:hypothetical protein L596_008534 [Steinernema carpocapsae]